VIVAVASGKGGTGKTTVAVGLALAVATDSALPEAAQAGGPRVLLLDCDVEEPNAHLFLKPTVKRRQEVGVLTPVVDATRCTACRRCAEVCAYHALAIVREQVLVFPELCHGCGSCTWNCPEGSIREELRPTGLVEVGQAGPLGFAQGTLNIGEAMAVPVIRQVKKQGAAVAPGGLVVVDSPPGTSCPVVESLRGADYALLVTEPTPFGLHDLRMAVEVARGELGLPVGVVVNRAGVGDDGVDRYCQAEEIPVLLRIPLDRRIAEACSEGVPLVEALPEYRQPFRDLYRQICRGVAR
jgi:MinD superfamily P-loop ATPase